MNSIADEKLKKDAITGDAEAQYRLGVFFYDRVTGPPADRDRSRADTAKALKWLRKAAEQGHAKAQCALGNHYDHAGNFGFFVSVLQEIYHALGHFYDRNEVEAVKWYRKAAEQDYAHAQYELGYRYANGRGVERDEVEAAKWYHKAAAQNHARAQKSLGCCYRDGKGVTKNLVEAYKWFDFTGITQRHGDEAKRMIFRGI